MLTCCIAGPPWFSLYQNKFVLGCSLYTDMGKIMWYGDRVLNTYATSIEANGSVVVDAVIFSQAEDGSCADYIPGSADHDCWKKILLLDNLSDLKGKAL